MEWVIVIVALMFFSAHVANHYQAKSLEEYERYLESLNNE